MLHYQAASIQFKDMSDAEFDYKTQKLLLEIYVITGWTIPNEENLLMFVRQFRAKVMESYSYLNPDEIEFGFRLCGKHVKEWGKNMNIAIIDQVIDLYLQEKSDAIYGTY